ncbi:hypothetical protein POM88_027320 [Heracleum sosnowskyi]|uniref:Uncharacterized protein n=1 Tax=Heracleum sosnowskyi TaxID=360622 RepID=A0AAD8I8R2_9APIA|nr:hypothetical protein POM88_027320 [Heracleum sosnowskyi]
MCNRNAWRKVEPNPTYGLGLGRDFHVCVNGILCFDCGLDDMMTFNLNKEVFNYAINKINLWVLDDEACLDGGIEASWTLMLNIDVNLPIEFVQSYLKSGDLLVLVDRVWCCLYNSGNKVVRNFEDFDSSSCLTIFEYAESLVSIPGFKQVNLDTN